jgi:zinc protease
VKLVCCLLAAVLTASAQVKLPAYTRRVLPNGVVLDLLPKKDVPMSTLRAVIKGGGESEPLELAGLASVTAELLRRGTTTRTADEFSDELDSIGASFSAYSDQQSTIVSSQFLSKDTDRALDLFADAILHPIFPQAEVTKAVAQRIDHVKSLKDSPAASVSLYFRSFFYPSRHPYAHPPDELSLAHIQRRHIVSYHKQFYAGKNLVIIAAGDIDPDSMEEKLAGKFGSLAAGNAYAWRRNVPPLAHAGPRLLLVDKPDATQTHFLIAQPGISRTHPERITLWLVNTLFGGRFTSMLNQALRVNSGLTYGAYSRLDQNRLRGAIAISTFTGTETTGKAIDLALEVLKHLRERGLTADQLASAKTYIKGTYPSERLETADQLAAVLGEIELYDLDRSEVDDLFARIDAVTLEQVNAAARRFYRPENLQFVLLGNAAKIREAVSKYAPKVVTLSITKPGFRVPAD